jgi:predicted lactoylglutathione lyase
MEQRVSFVTLGVADLDRSRRFYEAGLKWDHGYTDGAIAFYQLNGLVLALFENPNASLPPRQNGAGGVMLTQNVRSRDEVDAVLAAARAAGAVILQPALEMPWREYAGYFADPDGHPWEVAWNPALHLDEVGNVTLPG